MRQFCEAINPSLLERRVERPPSSAELLDEWTPALTHRPLETVDSDREGSRNDGSHFVYRFDNAFEQAPPSCWDSVSRGIPFFEPPTRSRRKRQRSAQSLSPYYSDPFDSPVGSLAPIAESFDPSNPSNDALFFEMGAWTGRGNMCLGNTQNSKDGFGAGGRLMQLRKDNAVLNSGSDQRDGGSTPSSERPRDHTHLDLLWDSTKFPLGAEQPVDLVSEHELPLWAYDFMDDFGVSGSRTGCQPMPHLEETPEEAGRWLPGEETRLSNDTFAQSDIFDCRQSNPLECGTSSTVLRMPRILEQGSTPMPFESLSAETYSIPTTLAAGSEIPITSSQIINLGETVVPALSSTPSAASPTAMVSASMFDTSLEEIRTLSLLQPNGNPHHQSSLRIILDDGMGDLKTDEGLKMLPSGRRGPLPTERALRIAKTRREKTVCLQCRMKKVSCTGGSPCDRCSNASKVTLFEQPCLKAHFIEIIKGGSCNYFSQRKIDHLTIDGTRRISKTLPEMIEFKELLSLVDERRTKFNISAFPNSHSDPLWTLDLSQVYRFLVKLEQGAGLAEQIDFRKFLDDVLPSAVGWEGCVKGLEAEKDLLAVLHKWNSMPSRVSFCMVPIHAEGFIKPIDIENPDQEKDVFLAAQLSRIVCRALENRAFESLQKALNEQKTYKKPNETKQLIFQLGRVLLQFRWRIMWWELSGDGGVNDQISKQRYIQRLQSLTKVLYFYYCSAKAKLPSYLAADGLQGTQSFYPGTAPFFDNFPHANTIPGFEAWMNQGRDLVNRAQAERIAGKVNPYPEHIVHAIV